MGSIVGNDAGNQGLLVWTPQVERRGSDLALFVHVRDGLYTPHIRAGMSSRVSPKYCVGRL